ncbi:recombinase [bacterium (Candidatus Moisslbacteria) CG_4_9_14_0_8_um_filter_36_20]|nr:MAG: recombinase [bacterium (Candidatus Moisslbacteria) CG_4_9_14_0_8_um_filter_36_20]
MLFLHVCCAPCALPIVEKNKDLILYFFNPNIYPEEEYSKRLKELEKVALILNLKIHPGEYNHSQWLSFIKKELPGKPQDYKENKERCLVCFKFRLEQTALFAKTHGFNEFATTLSLSRYKDVKFINEYGGLLAKKYGLRYKTFSFDLEKNHQRSLELSKKLNLYRQKYCGCEFSNPNKMTYKKLKKSK